MSNILWLILAVAAAMPLAWLIAEFQPRVWLRIALGFGSMLGVIAWAFFVMVGLTFESNSQWSSISQELIESTIDGLRNNETGLVLQELSALNEEFVPTYESSKQYEELVRDYSKRLKDQRSNELD